MNQVIKNEENLSEVEIKSLMTTNFLYSIEEFIKAGLVKNRRELANTYLNQDQSRLSLLNQSGRYVTIDMIYKLVNHLGLNANYIFVMADPKKAKEKLIREGVEIGSVIGDVAIGNGNANNSGTFYGNVINNVEKLIQQVPPHLKKDIQTQFDKLNTQISEQSETMNDLKKTLDECKTKMAGKDEVIESQGKELKETLFKYIELLEVTRKQK